MVWSAWGRYSAPSRARSSSPSLTRCTTHPLVGPNPRLVTHGPRECVPAAPVSTETQRETERVVSRPAPAHLTHVRPPVAHRAEERREVACHGRPAPIHTAEPRVPPLGEPLDHLRLAQRQEQREQRAAARVHLLPDEQLRVSQAHPFRVRKLLDLAYRRPQLVLEALAKLRFAHARRDHFAVPCEADRRYPRHRRSCWVLVGLVTPGFLGFPALSSAQFIRRPAPART